MAIDGGFVVHETWVKARNACRREFYGVHSSNTENTVSIYLVMWHFLVPHRLALDETLGARPFFFSRSFQIVRVRLETTTLITSIGKLCSACILPLPHPCAILTKQTLQLEL